MSDYNEQDRRRSNTTDITIILLEVQKVATLSASTNATVMAMDRTVRDMQKSRASNDDLEDVSVKLNSHILDHKDVKKAATESKRWSIGTAITVIMFIIGFLFKGVKG